MREVPKISMDLCLTEEMVINKYGPSEKEPSMEDLNVASTAALQFAENLGEMYKRIEVVKIGWRCPVSNRPMPRFTIVLHEDAMKEKITMSLAFGSRMTSSYDRDSGNYLTNFSVGMYIGVISEKTGVLISEGLSLKASSLPNKDPEGLEARRNSIKAGQEITDFLSGIMSDANNLSALLVKGFHECRNLYGKELKQRMDALSVSL